MSKVIECKGCIDCPFRYDDYNGDSMGYDTLTLCVLARRLDLPLYLVKSYDSWEIDNVDFTIETPIWCPLKNYGNIIIKIK